MKTVVVAVIGCGRIASGAHLPALQELSNVRIKYACDLILEKAEEAKKNFPRIERTITDYKDKGLGEKVTFGSGTQEMPSGLSFQ